MVLVLRTREVFALRLIQSSDISVLCTATVARIPVLADVASLFQVEIKEAGSNVPGSNPEDAAFQTPLTQESCCKFPSSQEAEEASSCPQKKDSSPMVRSPWAVTDLLSQCSLSIYNRRVNLRPPSFTFHP